MFYSQIILARKGPLGKIWLAAHFDKKLNKNQILSTDIPNSVESVLNPASPLALRVSGHLMLGIVRIYSRKVKYLLSDCTEAMWKIKLAFRPGDVDIDPTLLLNLNNVDDARFFGNVAAENEFNDLETAAFPQFLLSTFATQPTVSATTKARRTSNNVHEDGNVPSTASTPFDAEDFEGHRDEQRRSSAASSNNNRSRISMLDEGRKSNISDSNRFNDDIPAFDDNDLMDLDLGFAAATGAVNASTPTTATKPLLPRVQKDPEADVVLPAEEFDVAVPEEQHMFVEDMPSFDLHAYEPADEVIPHVPEPQKRVRTEKQQVRESPAVKRSTKRHRVEIDLRVELSTQQIKERMADLRPILRRDPDLPLPFKMQRTSHLLERERDLFAERDESGHLTLEEQLLMPASVRGLCPELQALFTMTTAREPSLPFPLREEFRVRVSGRSKEEKEPSGSAAEDEVLAPQQLQEQDVIPQFEEVPGEEFRGNFEGDFGPAMEPPMDDFHYAAQEQEDFANSSANLGGGSDVSTRASTKGVVRKQSHFLSVSKNSVSEEISRAVEQQGMADQSSVSGKATVSSSSAHSLNERTRAILTILEEQFQHKVSVSFDELSSGVTRRVAAGAFLEVLQLKTRGMLQVTQDEPFGMITVMPVSA